MFVPIIQAQVEFAMNHNFFYAFARAGDPPDVGTTHWKDKAVYIPYCLTISELFPHWLRYSGLTFFSVHLLHEHLLPVGTLLCFLI